METRENGFYWVKLNNEWLIAEWNSNGSYGSWLLTFEEVSYFDDHFEEIDEHKLIHP